MGYRNSTYASGVTNTYWFEKNLQGDIIAIYDENAYKLVSYVYDAWGKIIKTDYYNDGASTAAQYNPFRYRGYYYDSELGFYYLNSRYYDPETGRFINADGRINEGILGKNLFTYCESNPVMRSDSTGEWFGLDDLIAAGVGAVVGLASQFVSDVVTSAVSGSWQLSSWETYVGATVGGAVGGVTTLYAGPVAGTAVGAGSSTLIGQVLENATGRENRSALEIARNTVVDTFMGAALSKLLPVKISGITKGRNSMSAVFQSGLTKLGNKTASKMSWKVIGKGLTSGFVSDMGTSFGMGAKKVASDSWQLYY